LIISTPEHFNYQQCLVFLNRSPLECLFSIEDDDILKALKVKEKIVLFRLKNNVAGLQVDFPFGEPGKETHLTVRQYIIDWLDLDRDLRLFYRMAKKNPLLRKLVARYYGLRLIGIPDLFEALCWSVIGQQINLKFAYTLKKRLVESFGERVIYRNRDYWLFPAPAVLAALQPEELLNLQFSRNKAEYLFGIARRFAAGEISKESVCGDGQSLESIREQLLQIRGVGEWTANYVLMKCFRMPSAFPVSDAGLHNALKIQLGLPKKPSLAEIKQLGLEWTPWEAYATFYLWRSLI
jgi:DNA-3-methyladenine glycosylase II